jgi:hypothetical protein
MVRLMSNSDVVVVLTNAAKFVLLVLGCGVAGIVVAGLGFVLWRKR